MKFTFLENDQQALAKVASGVQYDLIHPCIAYWPDYKAAGLIQAFDPSLLPDYEGIPAAIRDPGVGPDGLIYHVPFDIGFSTLTYRADKVNPKELSWNLLQDAAYKGRMSLFSDEVSIIKIGHLINAGKPVDPNKLTQDEINAAADTMKQIAPNLRNFWGSQTDTVNDFVNGNIDITYTWPDGYWKIKTHPKMKGVPIEYLQPKEGRLAWVCGLVLGANTKVPGPRHLRGRRGQHAEDGRLADRRLPVRVGAAERRRGPGHQQGHRRGLRAQRSHRVRAAEGLVRGSAAEPRRVRQGRPGGQGLRRRQLIHDGSRGWAAPPPTPGVSGTTILTP